MDPHPDPWERRVILKEKFNVFSVLNLKGGYIQGSFRNCSIKLYEVYHVRLLMLTGFQPSLCPPGIQIFLYGYR